MSTDDITVSTEDSRFGNGWRILITDPITDVTISMHPEEADALATELQGAATYPGTCACGKPAIRGYRCGSCQDAADARAEATRARLTTKDWRDYSTGGATDPMSGRLA